MGIQNKINKILTAIRAKSIDIKIDRMELYSQKNEKYFYVYKVYIKEWNKNRRGEDIQKYIFQDEFISKVDLLKYLINKYQELKEGEANG